MGAAFGRAPQGGGGRSSAAAPPCGARPKAAPIFIPKDGRKGLKQNSPGGPRDAGEFFGTSFPVLFDLLWAPRDPGEFFGEFFGVFFSGSPKIGAGVLFL